MCVAVVFVRVKIHTAHATFSFDQKHRPLLIERNRMTLSSILEKFVTRNTCPDVTTHTCALSYDYAFQIKLLPFFYRGLERS